MRKTILIVEDDDDLRDGLQDLVRRLGFRAVAAANGSSALRLLGHAVPHLIVTDLSMPSMNGWQFIEEARRRPALARVPVIVFSASMVDDAPRLGDGVEFVPKPEVDRLIAIIKKRSREERRHDQIHAAGPSL